MLAPPSSLLSFFFRSAAKPFRLRRRLRPGQQAPEGGRLRQEPNASQARPDGADGPPHGYRRTRLAPPERLGGVFKVLAAGNGDRGAPGGFASIQPYFTVCLRTLPLEKHKKSIQLLAVDHSARASMKNAASCEK